MSREEYRKKNKERIKEYNKKYRESHKEYFIQYRKDNKEKISKYALTEVQRFNSAKSQSKRRKKVWELSFEEYCNIIKDPCYYCNGVLGKVTHAIGIDRIDSSIGYVKGNVLSCCYTCNRVKGDIFTVQETKTAIDAILKLRRGE